MEYDINRYVDNNGEYKKKLLRIGTLYAKGLELCNITHNLLDKLSKKKNEAK